MINNKKYINFDVTDNHIESCQNYCIVTGILEESDLLPSIIKINDISQGYLLSFIKRNGFYGALNQNLLLYDAPYFLNKYILLIGCGKKTELSVNHYIKIIDNTIKFLKNTNITKIIFFLHELNIPMYNHYWKIRHTIALFNKRYYTFNQFKSKQNHTEYTLNEVMICINNPDELENCKKAIKDGLAIANGINIAKDLSNMPANYCTPKYLGNQVQKLTNYCNNFKIEILNESKLKELKMHAYLAVNAGSYHPSIMPIIKYQNHPEGPTIAPIILIGKGVTFDSGGLSIKPARKMDEMKYDMCGAAAVYSVMYITSQLKLPLNIIGILAVAENMISKKSLKPGDIITTRSGQTVEILNTDAEGRLILSDVLTYVSEYNPEIVIDVATLTGACIIALGHHFSGLISNNDKLSDDLLSAGEQTLDHAWKLPLNEVFNKQLQSTHADMTNIGNNSGSVITAGCFLNKFVKKYQWAHLDIAGTAWISNTEKKCATGRPIELLIQFLLNKINKTTT